MVRRFLCNYRGYALGSFVEVWESEGGLDPLGFFVLFALRMELTDGFDGALEYGVVD